MEMGKIMSKNELNQIELHFESFIKAMYGDSELPNGQREDMEKSFFSGMLIYMNLTLSLDKDEEVAEKQLTKLNSQVYNKLKSLTKE